MNSVKSVHTIGSVGLDSLTLNSISKRRINMSETNVAFFATLVATTDGEAKIKAHGLAERKLKRQLAGAADRYAGLTLQTEAQIDAIYENLRKDPAGNFPVDQLIEKRINMEAQAAMRDAVGAEYKHLFGVDLPQL